MKVFCAVVILFVAGIGAAAVWFSPLTAFGAPTIYADNAPVLSLDGACYPADAICRVDFSGTEGDMEKALDSIFATRVKEVELDNITLVYAFSPRVAAKAQYLNSGEKYNVMAAYSDGTISIATPILPGCY